MQRIPDDSSIFTAEAKAVDLALDFISTCDANNKFIIFSDSLSVLKAMNHTSSKNPQIQKLLEKCHELLTYKEIVLCWIPSHIGIQGNEMVDKQAKTSLSLEPTSFKIPFSNFKPSINKYILEEWQTSWNNSIGYKLLDIKPTIGEYQSVVRSIRREEVVLARLLSHTSWGADRTTLLKLYRSLVRSKLDYGCIIYGSARKSYLQMLDPIHNQGLRLALGAFRTSPVASLYVEADEPSLYSRREKLSLQYAIRLAANPSNPAHEVTFPPNYVKLYMNKNLKLLNHLASEFHHS